MIQCILILNFEFYTTLVVKLIIIITIFNNKWTESIVFR